MKLVARLVVLSGIILTGCETAQDVAATSFRVIDTPANYLRRKIDGPTETTTTSTTSTTTLSSDAVTPGRPLNAPPPPPSGTRQRVVTENRQAPPPEANRRPPPETTAAASSKPPAAPPPRQTPAQQAQFPYAKPVPGKPGYVFSPFDPNGGYVDVSGLPPGSKAKDPYSQKIFLVP